MPNSAAIFSFVYITVFAVYIFFAVYIIHLNTNALLNKAFCFVCVSLCIWSLGFAMANKAPTAEIAVFWRRFTVIGYTTLYCNILYFLMVLTGRDYLLKKWWFYPLFFAPALENILVFCIINKTAAAEYVMNRVSFGWVSTSTQDIWDYIFYAYYISYMIACLIIVWQWKKRLGDKRTAREANLIIGSFVASLVLGSLTDVVLPALSARVIPLMGPVVIIIPITVMYYLIKQYGLMNPVREDANMTIMTDQTRVRLFKYLSLIFGALSLAAIAYLLLFLDLRISSTEIRGAVVVFFISVILYLIQKIRDEAMNYSLSLLVIMLSMPLVSMMFIKYGVVSSWIFPVIPIIISLVFNRRSVLLSVSAVSILSQVMILLNAPNAALQLSQNDYFIRISFYIAVILIGLYINRLYVSKLKENAYQIKLQKMVSDISSDFARVDSTSIEQSINRLLKKVGEFFGSDRANVFLIDNDSNMIDLRYEWCRTGIVGEFGRIDPSPVDAYTDWLKEMSKKGFQYREDIRKLPEHIRRHISESRLMIDKNVISLLSLPVATKDKFYGFIGFSSSTKAIHISENTIEIAVTFANLLADKLTMLKADEDIEYLAYFDQLTGQPNRQLFADRLGQAISLASRNTTYLGIVFINLNGFKLINDTMGHVFGDELICEIADTLKRNIRKSDTVAHFSGDEFVILFNDITDCDMIYIVVKHIMRLFSNPFRLHDQEYYVTASAGVAIYPFDGEDSESLIKNADIAMQKAKSGDSNQFAICTTEMKEEVQRNMLLSNNLYRALERNELLVYYQPQVNLCTGDIVGVEALVRWNHPKLGFLSPGLFIPLAEKNGLIGLIGEWVLRTACRQNKVWHDMGFENCRMAVNLSMVQFRNPRLVEIVSNALTDSGLDPQFLELEITESAAIKESGFIEDVLKRLKRLGVSISIDDFGTEYSSLTRLKEMPVDRIKIDMQFIRGLEHSEKDQAITMTIINLAKNLGLKVIAEGVETAMQLDFLRNKECDEVQGYYFYRPMPPQDFVSIFALSLP